jgi:hypothetical protein
MRNCSCPAGFVFHQTVHIIGTRASGHPSNKIGASTAYDFESLRTIARALEHVWNKTLSLWGDFQQLPGVEATESIGFMERAMGIEPTSAIWESGTRVV